MARVAQKYAMHTTVTGNAQRQKDSLVGEGPLNLPPQHWLASVCGFLGPGTTPGTKGVTMKQIGYVVDKHLRWADDMRERGVDFHPLPARYARFFQSLDEHCGLPEGAVCKGSRG